MSVEGCLTVPGQPLVRRKNLCLTSYHNKGRNLQGMAYVVGRIGEGQGAVVVDSWFCCQQGDMIDADNCLVDIPPALAAEAEGSGLGGFE